MNWENIIVFLFGAIVGILLYVRIKEELDADNHTLEADEGEFK